MVIRFQFLPDRDTITGLHTSVRSVFTLARTDASGTYHFSEVVDGHAQRPNSSPVTIREGYAIFANALWLPFCPRLLRPDRVSLLGVELEAAVV